MTDKEIIIDGVDVSRCVSFDKLNGLNICCYSDTREDEIPFANFCVENKDCYFKQHKRKERELEEKLSNKKKECDELHEILKLQKEEIKNLNYTLYEERNLTTDLAKANLKISALERDLSSVRNRFKYENQVRNEQFKIKEQECEKLKLTLQASDIAKAVISSAKVNCPIIEKLSNALDEIEEFCIVYSSNNDAYETVYKHIQDIIHKAKEGEQ